MGITDELRHEVASYPFRDNMDYDFFEAIADRIDAEHEKAMSRAGQLLADAEKDRDYNYTNWQECKQKVLQGNITFDELNARIESLEDELSHCIELPKDADGMQIHIGDKVTLYGRRVYEVDGIHLYKDRASVSYSGESGCGSDSANNFRHYHKPTVDDLLREFVSEFNRDDTELCDEEIIERFAAKLRLADDGEE